MLFAGFDIGSRAAKAVIINADEAVIHSSSVETIGNIRHTMECLRSTIPAEVAHAIVRTAATGYGRVAVESEVDATATEISCHWLGVSKLFPEVAAIIDIGGQDSKVIVSSGGRVRDFLMNDRCAAGTGRFLEVMTSRLGISLEDFAKLDIEHIPTVPINATCTVFAESEIVSCMALGTDPMILVSSVALLAARNAAAMAQRLHAASPIYFSGGVSRMKPVVRHLEKLLSAKLVTDASAVFAGAHGAALLALRHKE